MLGGARRLLGGARRLLGGCSEVREACCDQMCWVRVSSSVVAYIQLCLMCLMFFFMFLFFRKSLESYLFFQSDRDFTHLCIDVALVEYLGVFVFLGCVYIQFQFKLTSHIRFHFL